MPKSKEVGNQKKELAEIYTLRQEFWKGLLDLAKRATPNFTNRSPTTEGIINASAGRSGFGYNYIIRMDDAQVEFYVGLPDKATNKQLFDKLYARKNDIEKSFGHKLEWMRLNDNRASRISYVLTGSGLDDRDNWPELQKRMVNAMVDLQRVFQNEISHLS